ncbi:alpha/beta hydrolase [Knoellia aerolata]|uniref:Lipase n=1 Tax=Knoellia aerolata DSM 18566 TaxID=1385519 RepID=A0A0A0K4T6_9MICO|nr:alpha/beta hydrolase [Knoellia aerolata]KGN42841.1 lipase [Knoellia aerolata DSM 18566]
MRSYRGMSPVTTAAVALIDRLRVPVEDMSEEQRHEARASTHPTRRPFSWVLGGVDRAVGITFGTAPARDGYEIPLRIYRPRAIRDAQADVPVIVYFHGGGWVLGNVVNYDPLCTHLAAEVGAVVVSVDYRLAPEHPAPTAALDAVDATTWLAAQSDVLRADAHRMAVCGDSAGANLAAVVAQVVRDAGTDWIRHQALLYPATDLTMASPSIDEHPNAPILTRDSILAFRELYAPARDFENPLMSPLFGDLAGLPPALIQTADLDPIRDDGTRYAAALRSAGVQTRLTNYLQVPHGFASFPGASAAGRQHRWELVSELRHHLGTGLA